jgi:hypothetical protein
MKFRNIVVCNKCDAPLEVEELSNQYSLCDACTSLLNSFLLREALDTESIEYINEIRRHMGLEPRVLN